MHKVGCWFTLLRLISPISSPFFPVFCAFSPSRRGGSNEPQAGTQGQETAGKATKTRDLGPSFDTPGAVGRITWVEVRTTMLREEMSPRQAGVPEQRPVVKATRWVGVETRTVPR